MHEDYIVSEFHEGEPACPYCGSEEFDVSESEHGDSQKIDNIRLMEKGRCLKCEKEFHLIYRLAAILKD